MLTPLFSTTDIADFTGSDYQWRFAQVSGLSYLRLQNQSPYWVIIASADRDNIQGTPSPIERVKPWDDVWVYLADCPKQVRVSMAPTAQYPSLAVSASYFAGSPQISYTSANAPHSTISAYIGGSLMHLVDSTGNATPWDGGVTIQNATITIEPSASATFTVAGNVNVTNSTITIEPASGSTFTIEFASAQQVNVENIVGTNATVVNEQVSTGFDYQNYLSITVPAEPTPTGIAELMTVLPAGQQMSAGAFWVGIESANNYEYQVTLQPSIKFADGTSHTMGSPLSVTLTNNDGMSFLQFASSFDTLPVPLNGIIVTVTQQNASQDADTVVVYLSIPGQALPDENSVQFPKAVDPTFMLPGASSPSDMRYNAVPLPVQQFVWDGSAYIGSANLVANSEGYVNLAAGASSSTLFGGVTISRLMRVVLASSVSMSLVASGGATILSTFGPEPVSMDFSDAGGFAVGDTVYVLNRSSSAGIFSITATYSTG